MQTLAQYAGWISAIIACVTAIAVTITKGLKKLQAPLEQIRAENRQQTAKIDRLSDDVMQLTDDVSRLSGDRLNQAHEFYMTRGWCTGAKKRQLQDWYNAYKAGGHNHLADHYIEELIALPEVPPSVN